LGDAGALTAGAAVTLQNVALGYGRELALEGVTGRFEPGSMTAVIGPNGAGKSSLLKAIAGEIPLRAGRLTVTGAEAGIAFLPQQADLDRDFPISVGDVVAMGLWRRIGFHRRIGAADRARVERALAQTGLPDHAACPIRDLSVGQFQRVLFARLAAQEAALLLLDEPFAAVDEETRSDLMRLIKGWSDVGRTVICVLHDADMVRAHFQSACLLNRVCRAWGPTSEVLGPMFAAA